MKSSKILKKTKKPVPKILLIFPKILKNPKNSPKILKILKNPKTLKKPRESVNNLDYLKLPA
jgi:hypothetical protein